MARGRLATFYVLMLLLYCAPVEMARAGGVDALEVYAALQLSRKLEVV